MCGFCSNDEGFPDKLLCPYCGTQTGYGGDEDAWWFGEACVHLLWAGGSWQEDFDYMSEAFRERYIAKYRKTYKSENEQDDDKVDFELDVAAKATPPSAKIVTFSEYGIACGPTGTFWSAAFLKGKTKKKKVKK